MVDGSIESLVPSCPRVLVFSRLLHILSRELSVITGVLAFFGVAVHDLSYDCVSADVMGGF